MRYLLSILLCLWSSCAWAFPPGFVGAIGQAGGPTWVHEDDFAANSMSPYPGTYSNILTSGVAPTVTGGILQSQGTVSMQYAGAGANIGSAQVLQGRLHGGSSAAARLILRSDNNGTSSKYHTCGRDTTTTNYYINCLAVGGGTGTSFTLPFTGGTWNTSSSKNVRITVTAGGLYALYIDWDDDGDFNEAGEAEGTATNTTMSGTYGGIGFTYASTTMDNFKIGTP